jgi:hypothetical protein
LYFAIYPFSLCCTISGTHHVSNDTTGHQHAILSATTNQKLSAKVGYKNILAADKYFDITSEDTNHTSISFSDMILYSLFQIDINRKLFLSSVSFLNLSTNLIHFRFDFCHAQAILMIIFLSKGNQSSFLLKILSFLLKIVVLIQL